ncbi:MAG: leucyl/phenylalanyl-tRNA--protein transferase [Desulfobulbus propionicus]|nr:MAG: leucyl/phenylalanyl-tRNA--protein transferase [Desulfobulbus propionicus]
MPVFRLPEEYIFPRPERAEPDGLLAIGGDLEPARLIAAYRHGIFPWYAEGEPLLWWSPSPRLVLFPEEFHLPRRLARTLRQQRFTITADTAFEEVIASCAASPGRPNQETWITSDMQQAYCRLHILGYAHSLECWEKERLVGGLYGIALDRVFFGESMFTAKNDGSKACLTTLVSHASALNIELIDCQMTTAHLQRFGAREISRRHFQELLHRAITVCAPQKKWHLPQNLPTVC